jgi:hypothetical protein
VAVVAAAIYAGSCAAGAAGPHIDDPPKAGVAAVPPPSEDAMADGGIDADRQESPDAAKDSSERSSSASLPLFAVLDTRERMAMIRQALQIALADDTLPDRQRLSRSAPIPFSNVNLDGALPELERTDFVVMSPAELAARASRSGDFYYLAIGPFYRGDGVTDDGSLRVWVENHRSVAAGHISTGGGAVCVRFTRASPTAWTARTCGEAWH